MQGAIEQIRVKDRDVSSDDGLYSDDEEEEDDSGVVSYEEVEVKWRLCARRKTQESLRSSHCTCRLWQGQQRRDSFSEGELQAVYSWRAERDQEKQWSLAEAQRGLVQMGSPATVAELAATGQRVADKMTRETYARKTKEAEDTMKMIELEK